MADPLSRQAAWTLLREWVQTESLRRHSLAVEASMRAMARQRGGDEERWGLVGLLHDLDYERFPNLETGHPRMAVAELERLGYPDDVVRAIASHADYLGVSRDSDMEKSLYAVDELSGFVLACAYVRPTGIHGLTPKSVKKKLRDTRFAAGVDRSSVAAGAEELDVDLDDLVRLVVCALEEHAADLGVDGQLPG